MNTLEKFQHLLRTLFQFDCADLDFGIYRILNYKRQQVEEFITARLPQIVDEAFAEYAAADKAAAEQELEQRWQEIVTTLGLHAFDAKRQLQLAFRETPLGKQYLEAQKRAQSVQVAEELKTRVYNDLYTFFSRYYEDGDFISKRRYGRNETYAIPYNGEEVVLHWANRDQYYVKTGERFRTYRFTAGDYAVAFELRSADTEQNNNKGSKRYFVLAGQNPVEQTDSSLYIFFEYRPLTDKEQETYGKTEQQRPQDKLNEATAQAILEQVEDATLRAHLAKPESDNGQSLLLKHLTRFTRRNASDFFVHKDLRGFLRRELDFFIKHECLLLDELLTSPASNLSYVHLTRGRVVRDIGEKLIDFLAQVEDFQRRLFEKKKFVVRTEYCLTVDRVPEDLWDEVLKNTAQIAEWRELFALDDVMKNDGLLNNGLDKDFLRRHLTLVVDTRYFPEDPSTGSGQGFKWRLLASFDDLDDALDGVLVKSENFQALNLLLEKYRERVKCIYIDPPYNTSSSEILYKNGYKHSSWLSLIANRIEVSKHLLTADGTLCVTIDDCEFHRLKHLIESMFGDESVLGCAAIRSNPAGRSTAKGFSVAHEYALFVASSDKADLGRLERTPEQKARYSETDEKSAFEWVNFRKHGGAGANRVARPRLFYPIYASKIGAIRIPKMKWDELKQEWSALETPKPDETVVYPVNAKGEEKRWKWGHETVSKNIPDFCARPDQTGAVGIYMKSRMKQEGMLPLTWWDKKEYSATDYGTNLLGRILGSTTEFSFPKSVHATTDCLRVSSLDEEDLCLDFFAGSGTTAHAVINLNREDDGSRKYILVEMGDYFDTVLLPRIKKVVFCEKWKDGKPNGGEGVSHFVKYHTLEQYEDTLNNLELPREQDGQLAFGKFGDEYLLNYMLEFETQGSPCLLNLDRFKDPFAYRLKVQEGDDPSTGSGLERTVDVVETFNYLLGIQVKKVRTFERLKSQIPNPKSQIVYRAVLGEKDGKRVVIVWRALNGMEEDKDALMADKAFIEQTVLPSLLVEGVKPDRLLVNGVCYVDMAEAIEPEFKRLMFAGVA